MEDLLPIWEAIARRLLAQKLAIDDEINKDRGLSVCGPLLVFGLTHCRQRVRKRPPTRPPSEMVKPQ